MIGASWTFLDLGSECTVSSAAHTVSTGRVAFLDTSQAINCLATIIQSLRDKMDLTSGRKIDASPNLRPTHFRGRGRRRGRGRLMQSCNREPSQSRPIPYSSSFRYSVDRAIPRRLAASVKLPRASARAASIAARSLSLRFGDVDGLCCSNEKVAAT
jgi:hypothetical protein